GRGTGGMVRVSPKLHATLAARPEELRAALVAMRESVTSASGVPVPPLAVIVDRGAGETEVALALDSTPVAWFAAADVAGLRAKLPGPLAAIASELLDIDRVAGLVERAAVHSPVLVREVVPRTIALPVL